MGCFTTIIHPVDGRQLQIKCGWDVCEIFKVGDKVNSFPIKNEPNQGYLLDDAYKSYDDWVIIKDQKIVAVEPIDLDNENQYHTLRAKYDLKEHSRSLWSDDAWAAKEERDKKFYQDNLQFEESISQLLHDEQLLQRLLRPISHRLDYAGLDKCVTVTPLDVSGSIK